MIVAKDNLETDLRQAYQGVAERTYPYEMAKHVLDIIEGRAPETGNKRMHVRQE